MQRYKSKSIIAPISEESPTVEWALDPSVIAWDGGNGVSSAWQLKDGKLVWATLPNVRVDVTGFKINASIAVNQTDVPYADVWNKDGKEERYGIGDGVWEYSDKQPETFSNSESRYGSPIHIFMLLSLLAILEAPEGEPLTIVTSCPPSYINKVSKDFKRALMLGEKQDRSGLWRIRMAWDKKPRTFVIKKVVVLPEGQGSFSAYGYDSNGSDVIIPRQDNPDLDCLMGRVDIHDAGNGTYDLYTVLNGAIVGETVATATDNQFGVEAQIIEPLMDMIRDEFVRGGHSRPNLSKPQVDGWVRQWSSARSKKAKEAAGKVMVNGLSLSLHEPLTLLCERYARRVMQEKLEPSFRRGADTILATGGAWELLMEGGIKSMLPQKRLAQLLTPDNVPHLKDIPIWELNGYGLLVSAALNSKVAKKV